MASIDYFVQTQIFFGLSMAYDNMFKVFIKVYKQKTENAKREYLRELAAYRASLVSNGPQSASQQRSQQSTTQAQQQQPSRTKPY